MSTVTTLLCSQEHQNVIVIDLRTVRNDWRLWCGAGTEGESSRTERRPLQGEAQGAERLLQTVRTAPVRAYYSTNNLI